MNWINIKDRKPAAEQGNKIIAFGDGYIFECFFDDGFWTNIGGDSFSHWAEYPEIPSDI